jgi:uncharacterized SAM-binding protein YcdF (DUF218 family)
MKTQSKLFKKIVRILRGFFAVVGILAALYIVWMLAGWPIFIDRWLVKTERPVEAEYIVCLTNGLTGNNLPTEAGWQRIYTAVQLHADGLGRKVVISGGGAGRISEAEVYGEAARWLGLPAEALAFDPKSASTADHPRNILTAQGVAIGRDSILNIVTSPLHSRRVWMCFRRAGFTNFRVIAQYTARTAGPNIVREKRASQFEAYRPSGKVYNDALMRLRIRTNNFLSALREWVAIAAYKLKGYV